MKVGMTILVKIIRVGSVSSKSVDQLEHRLRLNSFGHTWPQARLPGTPTVRQWLHDNLASGERLAVWFNECAPSVDGALTCVWTVWALTRRYFLSIRPRSE